MNLVTAEKVLQGIAEVKAFRAPVAIADIIVVEGFEA